MFEGGRALAPPSSNLTKPIVVWIHKPNHRLKSLELNDLQGNSVEESMHTHRVNRKYDPGLMHSYASGKIENQSEKFTCQIMENVLTFLDRDTSAISTTDVLTAVSSTRCWNIVV